MKCVCASKTAAMSAKHQMCNAGQWCHTFTGACTM
jgi:hypothetical protein